MSKIKFNHEIEVIEKVFPKGHFHIWMVQAAKIEHNGKEYTIAFPGNDIVIEPTDKNKDGCHEQYRFDISDIIEKIIDLKEAEDDK